MEVRESHFELLILSNDAKQHWKDVWGGRAKKAWSIADQHWRIIGSKRLHLDKLAATLLLHKKLFIVKQMGNK